MAEFHVDEGQCEQPLLSSDFQPSNCGESGTIFKKM